MLVAGCILLGSHVIIPSAGRQKILELLHLGHPRMKELTRSFVWWPGMDSDLEEKVKSCMNCQQNQKTPELSSTTTPMGVAPETMVQITHRLYWTIPGKNVFNDH